MEMSAAAVAATLRTLLRARGLRIKELAKKSGVPRTTIHRHLRAETLPKLEDREAYARSLGVTPEEFESRWQEQAGKPPVVDEAEAEADDVVDSLRYLSGRPFNFQVDVMERLEPRLVQQLADLFADYAGKQEESGISPEVQRLAEQAHKEIFEQPKSTPTPTPKREPKAKRKDKGTGTGKGAA